MSAVSVCPLCQREVPRGLPCPRCQPTTVELNAEEGELRRQLVAVKTQLAEQVRAPPGGSGRRVESRATAARVAE